ncbi:hypothetical protein D3OALGB2SA_1145 [Olavius algarvensis associated proteobacterium Delta 3]|nr:hypothetical protein D3OALGB2SA_1145 [Olavius algarvensis associated proteobacterium Delta 3]
MFTPWSRPIDEIQNEPFSTSGSLSESERPGIFLRQRYRMRF